VIDMDSGKLALLEATGITVAERKQAEELYAASILASRVQGPDPVALVPG
jgi:hypothetical protein